MPVHQMLIISSIALSLFFKGHLEVNYWWMILQEDTKEARKKPQKSLEFLNIVGRDCVSWAVVSSGVSSHWELVQVVLKLICSPFLHSRSKHMFLRYLNPLQVICLIFKVGIVIGFIFPIMASDTTFKK